MGSRFREDVGAVFICFCEVVRPTSNNTDGWILQKYPESFDEKEILNTIPKFVYPCEADQFTTIQHFSFVLTNVESKWTFGFCRHDPKSTTALVFLSYLPWHEVFFRLLNTASDLMRMCEAKDLTDFLDLVFNSDMPTPGSQFIIRTNQKLGTFSCTIPDLKQLPKIPENRNLTEYYSAIETNNMLVIFASMLFERRIVFKSRKLHRLSACVQAANTVIYPMSWQHIFIPLLPRQLTDYLLAPMPFLIGIPTSTWEAVRKSDIGELVVLDADTNIVETPFSDLESLPVDVVKFLKTQLKNQSVMSEDGFARTFLKALVRLIGGYRDALKFQQGRKITFCPDAFVTSRPPSMQPFLKDMLHLQIFQQFVEERLNMLNAGLGFSDEFEFEACNYAQTSNSIINDQYKDWLSAMKKQGSAFLKSVKSKTNPAVKSAVKTVKEKGKDVKSAYIGIKTRIRKDGGPHHSSTSGQVASTFHRARPLTVSPSTAVTTFKKPRATSVVTSRSNEYVPLNSPKEMSSPQNDEDIPTPRLDMDLLGDLQDVINKQCSLLDDLPPVDRSLKLVRNRDDIDSAEVDGYLEPRAYPSPSSPNLPPHLPEPLRPVSRPAFNVPHKSINPLTNSNPFFLTNPSSLVVETHALMPETIFHREHLSKTNPFLLPSPGNNTDPFEQCPSSNSFVGHPTSECNAHSDLIRLDSKQSDGEMSRDGSDDSIKFKTGLTNPLYPYYSIESKSVLPAPATQLNHQADTLSDVAESNGLLPTLQSLQTNKSFVHTSIQGRSSNFCTKDMDLLREYGIDFDSSSNGDRHLSNFNPFSISQPANKANSQNNWMTFD